jgi:heat-inducible transcriptional repressor
LDERKAAILQAVVQEYIRTAQPVGSNHVLGATGVDVSAATVRNDMAVLESEGYLHQPHTSGPRAHRQGIPILRRFDRPAGPLDSAALQVRSFFANARRARADALRHQPAADPPDRPRRRGGRRTARASDHPQRAARRAVVTVVLAVTVLSNGAVERQTIELGAELADDQIAVRRPTSRERWSARPRALVW